MNILQSAPLATHSTMRLGGIAAYLCDVTSRNDISEAVQWATGKQLPILMIGMGSNIVWRDEGFSGLLLVNKIMGFEHYAEDTENYYITIGAGEKWDSVIARTVHLGLSGIEALSLIPGSSGATPVQNVGAYGQEISQTIVSIEAYDMQVGRFISIPTADCAFGYRTSRFKTTDKGRFLITGLTLHLLRTNPLPPFYPTLQHYLDEHNLHDFTPQVIRDAVVAIRTAKLPDPTIIPNNGSFFANPIVEEGTLTQIQANYPNVIYWPTEDGHVKLSAAWLVEHAGFKDYHDHETGMATWPIQPLIFINEGAKSTADLLKFKEKVQNAVEQTFGITLEQEPELLP